MTPVPASGPTIPGIDASKYQTGLNWTQVIKDGVKFAFLKATEGLTAVDSSFQTFKAQCHANGLHAGAYLYFHPALDPIAQADHFLATIGSPLGVRWMIDLETLDNDPANHSASTINICMQRIQKATGILGIIYGSPYFLEALKLPPAMAANPWFIAQYGPPAPLLPAPATTWTFWQKSGNGRLVGIPQTLDLDVFNGDQADLDVFFGGALSAPQVSA